MTYKETLEIVRKQNPEMSYKDAQQKAKEIYASYKRNSEQLQKETAAADAAPAPAGAPAPLKGPAKFALKAKASTVNIPELVDAEKRIRSGPVDVNKIISIGRQVIPNGQLVNHGKAANLVNSLVSFEDGAGNRLPTEGYFEIWL